MKFGFVYCLRSQEKYLVKLRYLMEYFKFEVPF